MSEGIFLAFEGCDGVGKTTQIEILSKRLNAFLPKDKQVVRVREPGGTLLGEKLRDILKDPSTKISNIAELALFFAARAELVQTIIRPALKEGRIVIADRFIESSYAYQGGGREMGERIIDDFVEHTVGETVPDLTFWLHLDPEIVHQRMCDDPSRINDRFDEETDAFAKRVEAVYRERALRYEYRYLAIDANKTVEELTAEIWRKLMGKHIEMRRLVLGENKY